MAYEVCPGQCVQHSGVRYAAGALVPDLPNMAVWESLGVVRLVVEAPVRRPKPVVKKKAPAKKKAKAEEAE